MLELIKCSVSSLSLPNASPSRYNDSSKIRDRPFYAVVQHLKRCRARPRWGEMLM